MKKFIRYHLPVILYAILIFVLSSIPNLGDKQSYFFGYDKIIHFFEYAIFAFLMYRSISHINLRIGYKTAGVISFILIVIFAILDELYQSRIPGRKSDPYDAMFDILGAIIIVIVLAIRLKIKEKIA